MICLILFAWIGFKLSAPVWYFTLVGIGFLLQIIQFGLKMYKAGKKGDE